MKSALSIGITFAGVPMIIGPVIGLPTVASGAMAVLLGLVAWRISFTVKLEAGKRDAA